MEQLLQNKAHQASKANFSILSLFLSQRTTIYSSEQLLHS